MCVYICLGWRARSCGSVRLCYLADITWHHTRARTRTKTSPASPLALSPFPFPFPPRGHAQVLEIEIIKQAGIETYTRTFELPVGKAYKMYDSIMRGLCEKSK